MILIWIRYCIYFSYIYYVLQSSIFSLSLFFMRNGCHLSLSFQSYLDHFLQENGLSDFDKTIFRLYIYNVKIFINVSLPSTISKLDLKFIANGVLYI